MAQAGVKVADDITGRQARCLHCHKIRMRTFSGQNKFTAVAAFGQPFANQLLAAAALTGDPIRIDFGGIDKVAAGIEKSIQQTYRIGFGHLAAHIGSPQADG